MTTDVEADVAVVRKISAIPSILEVVCQTTGMGFAAVARVTEDRWMACEVLDHVHFGLSSGDELPIKTTLCSEVRASRTEIVIDNVSNDPAYAAHNTTKVYGLQSYISVPIVLSDGTFFGTLCAIDSKPARLKDGPAIPMFRLFAQLIARHIDDQLVVAESRAQLAESLETGELREQFIAVLGHDLRNPLAAFQAGTNLLTREVSSEKARTILASMRQTADRMSALIENLLDLARGRLAGGIAIDTDETRPLGSTLEQVLAETAAAYPSRRIEARLDIDRAVRADHARIGQLFSNLLGNAIRHGAEEHPIHVRAGIEDGHLELSVANGGDPIPPDVLGRLFQPFYRGNTARRKEGLGLGLYIASQIAQAHGGRLDVVSSEEETRFTFRMPVPDQESAAGSEAAI